MKKLTVINLLVVLSLILASCGASNNVVSNKLISKRKYTKGFHINKKSNLKSSKGDVNLDEVDVQTVAEVQSENTTKRDKKVKEQNVVAASVEEVAYTEVESVEETYTHESSSDNAPVDFLSDQVIEDEARLEENSTDTDRTQGETAQENISASVDTGDPVMVILAIILALILPPVAIAVFDGITTMFWIDLVLFLLGGVFWFVLPFLTWACAVAAVVLAFLVIFDVI